MREREIFHKKTANRLVLRSSLIVMLLIGMFFSFAYSETGTLHLIYTNGQIMESDSSMNFEFDVKAYMTEGSDVIGDGMIYVQYPVAVFGELAALNNKITIEKTGILAGTIPSIGMDLYKIINTTDTYSNTFAVTFSATMPFADFKSYYLPVSTDSSEASDLLHISMDITSAGEGELLFPSGIAGIDMLYFDYESDLFEGGLDISHAIVTLPDGDTVITTPDDPVEVPVFAGAIELNKLTVSAKKEDVEIYWRTTLEDDLSQYIIERSEEGQEYSLVCQTSVTGSKGKFNTYKEYDPMTVPGKTYTYRLSAIDLNGTVEILASQTIVTRVNKNTLLAADGFSLDASYPNPFNPSFTVPFNIQTAQDVDIRLFNMNGEVAAVVATGYHTPGEYNIHVNCGDLASGVYLLSANINGMRATQKMLLVK